MSLLKATVSERCLSSINIVDVLSDVDVLHTNTGLYCSAPLSELARFWNSWIRGNSSNERLKSGIARIDCLVPELLRVGIITTIIITNK